MILVTGVKGQLGHDVVEELNRLGSECRGVDIDDFDLTNAEQTRAAILAANPEAVVHCAAFTAVDKAESMRELCRAVNVEGTRNVARACAELGAKMLIVSTDYVFDGQGTDYFAVDHRKDPINFYGQTKDESEEIVKALVAKYFIVRTSWLYGVNGANFVRTMLRLGAQKPAVQVVCDQIGSPTYSFDLARLICRMIQTDQYGTYHGTNEGLCSWAEFAQAIMDGAGLSCAVEPIPSSAYVSAAKRPFNSRLDKTCLDKAGFPRLPMWQDALARYLKEIC